MEQRLGTATKSTSGVVWRQRRCGAPSRRPEHPLGGTAGQAESAEGVAAAASFTGGCGTVGRVPLGGRSRAMAQRRTRARAEEQQQDASSMITQAVRRPKRGKGELRLATVDGGNACCSQVARRCHPADAAEPISAIVSEFCMADRSAVQRCRGAHAACVGCCVLARLSDRFATSATASGSFSERTWLAVRYCHRLGQELLVLVAQRGPPSPENRLVQLLHHALHLAVW